MGKIEAAMNDPDQALRLRQRKEYTKLCLELRIKPNSKVLDVLQLPEMGSQGVELHEYDFTGTYLGDKQFRPLAAALAIDRQLIALKVPGSGLMDAGLIALCEQLWRSQNLECLDISCNRFSISGA